ncbi:MAG: HK97 family phage prohead protease [Alphaproteobacteria bacterium]|nr:HK97 family phage prohead protease [Alphaproteobacteria bacterium]
MRFYAPIAKLDAEQRTVWGYASTEAKDEQGEIVTREALAAALDDYMRFANIREMHQPSAVGVAIETALDEKGLYVAAKVVDGQAWAKVESGVYKGFSIGGRVTARHPADRNVITALVLNEISLVDRPANPEAVFDCWKRSETLTSETLAGTGMMRSTPASGYQPVQIWDCGMLGHRHLGKAAAMRCIEAGAAGETPHPSPDAEADHADPGYQPDHRKRYPLDDEAHIRAVWAYIHKPDNAARYTPDQVDHIKQRIVAAWKARIDAAGPALFEQQGGKAARTETDTAVPVAGDALAEPPPYTAPMPLADAGDRPGAGRTAFDQKVLDHLHECLSILTAGGCCRHDREDTSPSAAARRHLATAHDHLCAAGARCGVPRAAVYDALAEADQVHPHKAAVTQTLAKALEHNAALISTLGDIVPRLDRLTERVEDIARTPMPPLTAARAVTGVSKRDDANRVAAPDDVVTALAEMSGEERTIALIKAAHANPFRPLGLGAEEPRDKTIR